MSLFEGALVAGEYAIEHKLGTGAFGAVWRAVRRSDGQHVAIKELLRQDEGAADNIARFRREAVNLRRVKSEYVARLIDFVVDDSYGMLLIMEFIDGELLSDILLDTNLSINETLELGTHLCHGLSDLHAVGVIHRDIKPSNIMIRSLPNGMQRAIIFDLGLSRFNPVSPEDSSGEFGEVTNTASRVAIGTPAYMAPEQILDARSATETSDIYATGAVLYLAASGRHPYIGDERTIANLKLTSEALPVDIGRLDTLGMRFADVIGKAIRRRPEERFANAAEFQRALGELRTLATEGVSLSMAPSSLVPRPPEQVHRARRGGLEDEEQAKRAYWVAAIAGSLALLIAAATYFLRH